MDACVTVFKVDEHHLKKGQLKTDVLVRHFGENKTTDVQDLLEQSCTDLNLSLRYCLVYCSSMET